MFYRNLFAGLCFLFFGLGFLLKSPHAFWGALMCGALSRTAARKKWPDPPFAAVIRDWFQGKLKRKNGFSS